MNVSYELERRYVLLLLGALFCKCHLGQYDWYCCLGQLYPLYFLPTWSITYWKGGQVSSIRVHFSFSPCSFITICLTYFEALLLATYTSRMAVFYEHYSICYYITSFLFTDSFSCFEIWFFEFTIDTPDYNILIFIRIYVLYLSKAINF